GLTFPEEQSVSEAARIDCERRRQAVSQWAAQRSISIQTPPAVDDAPARFFREEFLGGGREQRRLEVYGSPGLREARPGRAAGAAPPRGASREGLGSPCPSPVAPAPAVAGGLPDHRDDVRPGLVAFAWIAAVAFALYLRPREALDLAQSQLVPPGFATATGARSWCVVLHMFERLAPSKTGVFDESLLVDSACFPWMSSLVAELHRRTPAGHRLFPVTYARWNYHFKAVVSSLGLNVLGNLSLRQLLHGGASHELCAAARPLKDIQKRGRWATNAALHRYAKGGRVQEQLRRLPPGLQAQAERAFSRRAGRGIFLEVFSGARRMSAAWRLAFKAQHAAFELDFKNSSSHDLLLGR
ncbi:unnamed protein product, partial [Prorocentrum cordatum]